METRRIGIILNGVTGRMGTNQHLVRSILAIVEQGGLRAGPDLVIMPDPILTGRNEGKLTDLASRHGSLAWSTDVAGVCADADFEVFFDASGTAYRDRFVRMAAEAGKAIYCEKPTGLDSAAAFALAEFVESHGCRNGVVQDKLWLPGILKLRGLIESGFFGRILTVKGDFGYWVFSGHTESAQRPSWNYRSEDGGGIVQDMFCHWQYVIEETFGPIARVLAETRTHVQERVDEGGVPYACTADDGAYALFVLDDETVCQFNSSWATRVRRDDLLTIQVDGTDGSAVAGLRECRAQSLSDTPRPVWNPDVPQPVDFRDGWQPVATDVSHNNAFKVQWELFLKHVVLGDPFPWTLRRGARGVLVADLGLQSAAGRCWVDVPRDSA